MKILVMGLPGSGKTWLAERLSKHLECAWFNADEVRKMANDWQFGIEARLRQAGRMANLANYENSHGRTVICDFVCPTEETRQRFNANFIIWMNTISQGRYEDTNKMFDPPKIVHKEITRFMTDKEIEILTEEIKCLLMT